jgi:hypothetical protein
MRPILLALLLLSVSAIAFAQQPPQRGGAGAIRGPCREDAEQFCKGVAPGAGRVLACLKGNVGRLSPACKEQLKQVELGRTQRQQRKGPATPAPQPAQPAQPPAPAKP